MLPLCIFRQDAGAEGQIGISLCSNLCYWVLKTPLGLFPPIRSGADIAILACQQTNHKNWEMAVPKAKGSTKVHERALRVDSLRRMSSFYLSVLFALLTTVTTTMATKDILFTEHHILWRDTSLTLTADHLRYISKTWVELHSEMNHNKSLSLQIHLIF